MRCCGKGFSPSHQYRVFDLYSDANSYSIDNLPHDNDAQGTTANAEGVWPVWRGYSVRQVRGQVGVVCRDRTTPLKPESGLSGRLAEPVPGFPNYCFRSVAISLIQKLPSPVA